MDSTMRSFASRDRVKPHLHMVRCEPHAWRSAMTFEVFDPVSTHESHCFLGAARRIKHAAFVYQAVHAHPSISHPITP